MNSRSIVNQAYIRVSNGTFHSLRKMNAYPSYSSDFVSHSAGCALSGLSLYPACPYVLHTPNSLTRSLLRCLPSRCNCIKRTHTKHNLSRFHSVKNANRLAHKESQPHQWATIRQTLPSLTVGYHSSVLPSTVTVRSAQLSPQNERLLRRPITRDASTRPSIDRIRLQFRRLYVAEKAISRH